MAGRIRARISPGLSRSRENSAPDAPFPGAGVSLSQPSWPLRPAQVRGARPGGGGWGRGGGGAPKGPEERVPTLGFPHRHQPLRNDKRGRATLPVGCCR